jgi:hypothetical protein
MKYKSHFCGGWRGTWKLEALNDARAWEIIYNMIKEHTSVVSIDVESIFETDETGIEIRKLENYENCKRDYDKKRRVTAVKKDEIAVYKAYFSDGECSGPFVAKLSENDAVALELANNKLNQHIAYNGLQNKGLSVIKVVEVNNHHQRWWLEWRPLKGP